MYGQVWYSGTTVPDMNEDFRRAIMQLAGNLQREGGRIDNGKKDYQIRSNSIYPIDSPAFKSLVLGWVEQANDEKEWDFDITGIQNLQLSEYTEGQKYSWHIDMRDAVDENFRKLSFNVVLNDTYEGGDFQFSWGSPSASYRRRVIAVPQLRIPGRMAVFPSYYYHRVTPVTSGTRYSLTGWVTGPSFR